ncbi:MAG TPA: HypC/HybG/HupF family hydrogenase formation chaperone [Ktedonobacteraceae bacterium]|jgi:hydrogenase assembly chaperone HypC/HupF|nr:HypC/HybG/HupF family hydrogenase formation chaperone [Ktedonobacteraceae bacterium]
MSNKPEKAVEIPANEVSCVLDAEGHCITCSDEALEARVVRVDEQMSMALVEIQGDETEVDITLVEEMQPGDWLLVHGGVAIANLEKPASDEAN